MKNRTYLTKDDDLLILAYDNANAEVLLADRTIIQSRSAYKMAKENMNAWCSRTIRQNNLAAQQSTREDRPMKTNHTPGPWIRETDDGDNVRIIDSLTEGTVIALLKSFPIQYGIKVDDREAERDANAALISAAPDLLACVKMQQDLIDAIVRECPLSGVLRVDAIAAGGMSLRAIAKAEGSSAPCVADEPDAHEE